MHQVAETILAQLGGQRFIAMTGAKDFVGNDTMLMFALPGRMAKNKANKCRITLNPMDTYDLEFFRIRKLMLVVTETIAGVYAEDLQRVFTKATGLDTHL